MPRSGSARRHLRLVPPTDPAGGQPPRRRPVPLSILAVGLIGFGAAAGALLRPVSTGPLRPLLAALACFVAGGLLLLPRRRQADLFRWFQGWRRGRGEVGRHRVATPWAGDSFWYLARPYVAVSLTLLAAAGFCLGLALRSL